MKTSEVYFFHNTAAIWLEACSSKISNDITNLNDQTLFKCHCKLMLFGEQRVVDIFSINTKCQTRMVCKAQRYVATHRFGPSSINVPDVDI